MMVLPVPGLSGPKGPKGKGGKKGKKGKGGNMGEGVQVNLIVDPRAFGRPEEDDEDTDEDEDVNGESIPGAFDPGSSRRKRRRAKRRSVFAGLAMEEAWKDARAWAKKLTVFDSISFVLWGAEFVYILIGKRCPSGTFGGWLVFYFSSVHTRSSSPIGATPTTCPRPLLVCYALRLASAYSLTFKTFLAAKPPHGLGHELFALGLPF